MSKRGAGAAPANELDNDVVTVSKLQVALLASARQIQQQLNETSLSADLETPEGRCEFLQETALGLLRHPEYWVRAQAVSETVENRDKAGQRFQELSIEERSKFSAETFANVGGQVKYREALPDAGDELASYIVVTLLVGTEDDRPLFDQVYSDEELKAALQRAAAITPEYLLVLEVLWSPQEDTDVLTEEQLLTLYGDLVQI
jgi:uncharacterized membrane protein